MVRKSLPESESKMILLKALDLLGEVSAYELCEYLSEVTQMNYFDQMLHLTELQASGHVIGRTHPLGTLYTLSSKGQQGLGEFYTKIPPSTYRDMQEAASSFERQFRHEQQSPAQLVPLEDGDKYIRLRLMEKHYTAMDLICMLPRDTQIPFLQERWNQVAPSVYAQITCFLTEGYDPSAVSPPLTPLSRVEPSDNGEWLLLLQNETESPSFSLTVSLADQALCLWWAFRWKDYWQDLRTLVLSELENCTIL